jgi:hypothetical protein
VLLLLLLPDPLLDAAEMRLLLLSPALLFS